MSGLMEENISMRTYMTSLSSLSLKVTGAPSELNIFGSWESDSEEESLRAPFDPGLDLTLNNLT